MSVGKGIEEKSTLALRKAVESGYWICLKNVHLIPDWLNVLDSELSSTQQQQQQQQQSSKLHPDFRLFLTCETMRGFPDLFMSKCNKILYEAPDGVRNKIQRLLQQWGQMLNDKRDPKVLKLYIILFILNSILLERRSFIPQGREYATFIHTYIHSIRFTPSKNRRARKHEIGFKIFVNKKKKK